jgi:general stress protein 26
MFPTFKNTRKINDIKNDPDILIKFPSSELNEYYEIKGNAKVADDDFVDNNWVWWYLYWYPERIDRYSLRSDAPFTDRAIILIEPISAKKIKMGTK